MSKEKQRTISKEQLLILQGIIVLRDECLKQYRYIERAMASLLDEPEDGEDYFGLVSDFMWEDAGAKQLIKNLDIKVI